MAVRLIKGSWWIDFRANHTRYRKRSPENSRAGAQEYEAALRQKLARGQAVGKLARSDCEMTFERFAQRWIDEYAVPNNKYSEVRSKKYILSSALVPFFGRMQLSHVTAYDIERFKAHQIKTGVANKTIKNRLTVLSKLLCTAYEWLELEGSPPKIKWPKCVSNRTDYLSYSECELLLSFAEGVVHDMILIALRTGMRPGEIAGLQWSSIEWETRSLAVRHSRCDRRKDLGPTKNNKERHIPLDTDIYQMLFKRKCDTGYVFLDAKGEPFTDKRFNLRLANCCKRAGLRRITWHILRHTFASHLAMRGAPLPVIQQLLGHSSITTTMRYAHVAPSTLRAAIELLNPKTLADPDFGQPVGNRWLLAQRQEFASKTEIPKNG